MKPQTKFVVSTDLIKVMDNGQQYVVHIALSEGGWIEHNPFERSQQGLVAALLLAADVNAGKFWLKRAVAADFKANSFTPRLLEES